MKEEDDIECLGDALPITSVPVSTESSTAAVDKLFEARGVKLIKDMDAADDDPNSDMIESIAHQIAHVKVHYLHLESPF